MYAGPRNQGPADIVEGIALRRCPLNSTVPFGTLPPADSPDELEQRQPHLR